MLRSARSGLRAAVVAQYLNKASSLLLTPRHFTLSFSPILFLKREKTWGSDPHIGTPTKSRRGGQQVSAYRGVSSPPPLLSVQHIVLFH